MKFHLHRNDLPANIDLEGDVAVDTETMGLNPLRDRLCLVQISDGGGEAHLVQFDQGHYEAPHLVRYLTDDSRVKIFHFARFDVAVLKRYLDIEVRPVYCTKIASKLARTYTDRHGLKDLCKELLNKDISKQQQSSNWGSGELSKDQLKYAASDVLYLHELRDKLDEILVAEKRAGLAQACFNFIPVRAQLDLLGWAEHDIFDHKS